MLTILARERPCTRVSRVDNSAQFLHCFRCLTPMGTIKCSQVLLHLILPTELKSSLYSTFTGRKLSMPNNMTQPAKSIFLDSLNYIRRISGSTSSTEVFTVANAQITIIFNHIQFHCDNHILISGLVYIALFKKTSFRQLLHSINLRYIVDHNIGGVLLPFRKALWVYFWHEIKATHKNPSTVRGKLRINCRSQHLLENELCRKSCQRLR